jgi:hypothetical protein
LGGLTLLLGAALASATLSVRSAEPPIPGVEEASGLARDGDRLLLVGDNDAGVYYSYPLPADVDGTASGRRLPIDPAQLTRHALSAGPYAADLESITVLADGRVAVLSESLGALLDADGPVAVYPRSCTELGGRGLEGLAVRPLPDGGSRIAVLWEGGYPEDDALPPAVRTALHGRSMRPRVFVHDLAPGARDVILRDRDAVIDVELRTSRPVGTEPTAQRFRAPDLVWHEWEIDGRRQWGFIVLMSSGWAERPASGSPEECPPDPDGDSSRWCYRRLQRFTTDGRTWGDPLDLDTVLPSATRTLNWEGLSWLVPGQSLMMIYDEKLAGRRVDPPEAFVFPLPEGW